MPFGESLMDSASSAKFAKGFTNHEQTDPSGLIYMQARFYAPWFGRFLSPDPARDQHFEETQSWNIYSYVQNDPTMKVDPTGMVAEDGKLKRAWEAVKNFFNYERHSSSSTSKAADGGTITRDKVDVERKITVKGGQAKASLSYQSHDLHNENKGEKRIGPVFFEAGATQTKGSVGGEIGAEAGLKGVKAQVGVSVGPSLTGEAGAGFRVAGYKVTVLGGEVGGQIRVGAEAKVVHREGGGFTLATARVFGGLKLGLTLVNIQKEHP
jgi:RHS repeat-associated protein